MSAVSDSAEQIFRTLDPPLWVVTSAAAGQRGGLLASFVAKASTVKDYPRLIVGIGKRHHTWGLIEQSGRFILHQVGLDQVSWVERFGMQSGRDRDKFIDMRVSISDQGQPILLDAPSWIECRVEAKLDSGDRTLYLGRAIQASASGIVPGWTPLTFGQALPHLSTVTLARFREAYLSEMALDAEAIRAWQANSPDCLLP